MKSETKEYLRTSRPYLSVIIGGAIGAILGAVTNNWLGLLIGQFFGAIVALLFSRSREYVLSGILGSCSALLAVIFLVIFSAGAVARNAIVAMIFGIVVVGFCGGVIACFCKNSHTIANVFHSPRFLVGFTIISLIVLTSILYPMIDTRDPMYSYGDMFLKPGTYFSIYDANVAAYSSTTNHRILNPNATGNREENFLPTSQLEVVTQYLARKWAWEQGYTVRSDFYVKTDGTQGDARNLEKDLTDRIAGLEAQIAEKQADLESKQAELTSDAEMPEAKRNRYNQLIGQRQAEIETIQGTIDSLRARFDAGMIILDSEALRLITGVTE